MGVSRWRRAVNAALAVNGVSVPTPAASPSPAALPPATPAKRPKPDRVLVLGAAGVLVTAAGRLPRDGEVEHDGVALRVAAKGGPVLVAGSLRKVPAACRWVPASALHRVDLAVLRQVAPAHARELDARERVAALAGNIASVLGLSLTGDPEHDLRASLDALRVHEHCSADSENNTRLALRTRIESCLCPSRTTPRPTT